MMNRLTYEEANNINWNLYVSKIFIKDGWRRTGENNKYYLEVYDNKYDRENIGNWRIIDKLYNIEVYNHYWDFCDNEYA